MSRVMDDNLANELTALAEKMRQIANTMARRGGEWEAHADELSSASQIADNWAEAAQ